MAVYAACRDGVVILCVTEIVPCVYKVYTLGLSLGRPTFGRTLIWPSKGIGPVTL